MSKKNDLAVTPRPVEGTAVEKKYPTERLLRSKHLAGYQPDFARVILTEPALSLIHI